MGLFNQKEGRLAEKWSYQAHAHVLCGPLVDDVNNDGAEEIIIGTKDGRILLLDLYAKEKWVYKISETVDKLDLMFMEEEAVHSITATPKAYDLDGDGKKEIVFGTQLGTVYCITCEGKLLWKYQTESSIKGGVAFCDVNNDGRVEVIVGSDDKKLHVLTSKGKLLWSHTASAGIQNTPAVSKQHNIIVFGDDNGNIICLSFDNKVLWTYKTEDKIVAEPVVRTLFGDNQYYIIVGSTDTNLYVLDINGNLKWKYQTQGGIVTKVEIEDMDGDGKAEILVSSCDNTLYALTCEGSKVWSYETNFWIGSSALVMDIDNDGKKEIIVGSYDHNLYVLNAEGSYVLEHIPGLSHVIHQAGHYSDIQTQDAGVTLGKKIWQFTTPDIILGIGEVKKTRNIILTNKTGNVLCIEHSSR
jgi:WD40 repeat protein